MNMNIKKIISDRKPDCCADCMFLSLRNDDEKWPHVCYVTDDDVMDTEGRVPDSCPITE